MKKILLGLLALIVLVGQTQAFTTLDGLLYVNPTARQNKGTITKGSTPGAVVNEGYVGVALVNITAGDVLVGPLGTSVTARMGVSKTTTSGDTTVIGIAATSANYGVTVSVATQGIIKVCSVVNSTVGAKYCTGGTAGQVTATSALTGSLYTGISGTPTIITALETVSSGGGGYFLGLIGKR